MPPEHPGGQFDGDIVADGWTWRRSYAFAAAVVHKTARRLDYSDRDEAANLALYYAAKSYRSQCPWKQYLARAARHVAIRHSRKAENLGFSLRSGKRYTLMPRYVGEPLGSDRVTNDNVLAALVAQEILDGMPPKTAAMMLAMANGATQAEVTREHGYATHGAIWRHILKARQVASEYIAKGEAA